MVRERTTLRAYAVGERVVFSSQYGPWTGKKHVLSDHAGTEEAVIVALQRDGDGVVFNYKLNVADGCTFWASPWEVSHAA